MMVHLKNVADQVNLPLNDPQKAYNTRLAQEIGKWAGTQGKSDTFHHTIFNAYFVNAADISDPSTLIDLAVAEGLSRNEAKKVIDNRTFKDAVDQDWTYSQKMFVTSVPTFLINEQRLVGAQSYEVLKKWLYPKFPNAIFQ